MHLLVASENHSQHKEGDWLYTTCHHFWPYQIIGVCLHYYYLLQLERQAQQKSCSVNGRLVEFLSCTCNSISKVEYR